MGKRRKNNGYTYKVVNGQWFVQVRGSTRRRDQDYGPYGSRDEAEAFIRNHAAQRGNQKYIHPEKIETRWIGPPLSNQIPRNGTKPVKQPQVSRHGKKGKNGKQRNKKNKNKHRNEPIQSFDQIWNEGIKKFFPDRIESIAA